MNSKLEIDKFLNEYLKIYQENPRSRVFAPLAEAYRKSKLIDEAIEICKEGLAFHPDFASGLVALARCYFDKQMYKEAIKELKTAVSQAPDNYLAQKLLAESYFIIKNYQNSIKTYKVLSFLNPKNNTLKNKITEIEFLLKQNKINIEKEKEEKENKKNIKTNIDKNEENEENEENEIPPIPYNLNNNFFEDNKSNLISEIDKNLDFSFQEKPLSKLFTQEIDFNNDESILKEFKTHTLAQLLIDQGHKSKALEVYKSIFKDNPKDIIAKNAIINIEESLNKIIKETPIKKDLKKILKNNKPKPKEKEENKKNDKKSKNIKTIKTNISKETLDDNWITLKKNSKIDKLNNLIKKINN